MDFSLQHFRFHLEPKGLLRMPAYNKGSTQGLTPKGNVIRDGFGSTFRRIVCCGSCREPANCAASVHTVPEIFPMRRELGCRKKGSRKKASGVNSTLKVRTPREQTKKAFRN